MASRRVEAAGYRARARANAVDRGEGFYASALRNFDQIRSGALRQRNPCSAIEHYTDVVAEATAANVLAYDAGDKQLTARADRLRSKATHAMRGAIHACALRGRR